MKVYFYRLKDGEIVEEVKTARKNKTSCVVVDEEHRDYYGCPCRERYIDFNERKILDHTTAPYMFSYCQIDKGAIQEKWIEMEETLKRLNDLRNEINESLSVTESK